MTTKKRVRNYDFTQTHFNLCEESLLETSADELSARLARSNTALIGGGGHATTSSTRVKQSQSTVSAGRSLFQQLQTTSKTTTTTTTVFKYVFIFLVLFATTNVDMFCVYTIRSEKSISNTINVNNNNHSSSTAKPSQSSASTSGGSSSTAAAYIKAVRSELGAEYEVFKRILSKYRVDKDLETLVANVTFLMFVENTIVLTKNGWGGNCEHR